MIKYQSMNPFFKKVLKNENVGKLVNVLKMRAFSMYHPLEDTSTIRQHP